MTFSDVQRAVAALRRGGLVAFPTETVYGLAVRADDDKAVARLYRVKERPADKGLIVHVTGIAQARAATSAWPALATALVGCLLAPDRSHWCCPLPTHCPPA